ncbi:hypothetical protein BROUX41_001995 [Berkeleyomyces rouxiae]|uniref:uncharacterized protein n=1 Tax=Berkeleyomyces rouxiae TaxID=2035830 RepID=UPI003B75DD84
MTELTTQIDINGLLAAAEARLSSLTAPKKQALIPAVDKSIAVQAQSQSKKPELEVRQVDSASHAASKTETKDTAGSGWFDLPKTNLTPELKRDLQLLRLRNALNPKVHYKKQSLRSQVPRYSHVGEVVAGPTEFFSSRVSKHDRQRTFADEVLAAEKSSGKFKSKYSEIQVAKTSGRKAFAKARKAARKSK